MNQNLDQTFNTLSVELNKAENSIADALYLCNKIRRTNYFQQEELPSFESQELTRQMFMQLRDDLLDTIELVDPAGIVEINTMIDRDNTIRIDLEWSLLREELADKILNTLINYYNQTK
jgi:hypothetical protein